MDFTLNFRFTHKDSVNIVLTLLLTQSFIFVKMFANIFLVSRQQSPPAFKASKYCTLLFTLIILNSDDRKMMKEVLFGQKFEMQEAVFFSLSL